MEHGTRISFPMDIQTYTDMTALLASKYPAALPCFAYRPETERRISLIVRNSGLSIRYGNQTVTVPRQQIHRVVEQRTCLLILLRDNRCLYIPVRASENYNCQLCDVAQELRTMCRFRYQVSQPLELPEEETAQTVYRPKSEPLAALRYQPSNRDLLLMAIWPYRFAHGIAAIGCALFVGLYVYSQDVPMLGLLLLGAAVWGIAMILTAKELRHVRHIAQDGIVYTLYEECLVYHALFGDIDFPYSDLYRAGGFFSLQVFPCVEYRYSHAIRRHEYYTYFSILIPKKAMLAQPVFTQCLQQRLAGKHRPLRRFL